MNYIFDVDGTLTPSRLPIDKKFKKFFIEWMKDKTVYLVTGSDKEKTIEQIGEEIWNNCTRAYQSCGNAVYEKGKLIRQSDFKLDRELQRLLFTFKSLKISTEELASIFPENVAIPAATKPVPKVKFLDIPTPPATVNAPVVAVDD